MTTSSTYEDKWEAFDLSKTHGNTKFYSFVNFEPKIPLELLKQNTDDDNNEKVNFLTSWLK